MPNVNFFEIPVNDLERAKNFYGELFDWKIEKTPTDIGFEYFFINTKTKDNDQSINGGMVKKTDPKDYPINYISVDSVDNYSSKIEGLGGKILIQKTPVKGMGFFVFCEDTENNRFAIWEDNQKAGSD